MNGSFIFHLILASFVIIGPIIQVLNSRAEKNADNFDFEELEKKKAE